MEKIKQLEVVVDRRYIFVELGSNQIRMADKVFQWILQLTAVIQERNKESRIYFVGVLLRPVENEEAKPNIIMFNRWMVAAVKRLQQIMQKVEFISVQLRFLMTLGPRMELCNQQHLLTLSEQGAKLLRASLFQAAGFVRNS